MPEYCGLPFYRKMKSPDVVIGNERKLVEICSGVLSIDPRVCRGQGVCVDFDQCNCSERNFGDACGESFGEEAVFRSSRVLAVSYVTSISTILDTVDSSETLQFDCQRMVEDLEFDAPLCSFEFDYLDTVAIRIEFASAPPADWNTLVMHPLTEPNKTLSLLIVPYKDPIVETSFDAVVSVLVTLCILVFLFLVVSSMAIAIFCGFKLHKQKQTLEKLQELDDVDILILENEMREVDCKTDYEVNFGLGLEIQFDDVQIQSELGRGGSNTVVYKAEWNDEIVAFKSFVWRGTEKSDLESFLESFEREVSILASIRHDHILPFFGACVRLPRVGIVMKFCSHGDVKQYLLELEAEAEGQRRNDDGDDGDGGELMLLPWREKVRIITEVCRGLSHLHSRRILHRDMKWENVLLSDNLTCFVMDFGLSRAIQQVELSLTRGLGTSHYIAPEMIRGEEYGTTVDVFSLSLMMWELCCECFYPYGEEAEDFIEFRVAANPHFRPSLSRVRECGGPNWFCSVLRSAWSNDPGRRPSVKEILEAFENPRGEMQETVWSDVPEPTGEKTTEEALTRLKLLEEENLRLRRQLEGLEEPGD